MAQIPITPIMTRPGRALAVSTTPTSILAGGTALSIPGATLSIGDRIRIEGWVTKATVTQAMTTSVLVGGVQIGTVADVPSAAGTGFLFEVYVTGASAETAVGRMSRGDTNLAAVAVTALTFAIASAVTVDVQVSGTAGDTATLQNIAITVFKNT